MKTNQNLRRFGEKKGNNNKISHAEFDGGAPCAFASSTHAVVVNDNNLRGRFQIKFAMTIDNNRAFTLIELLVVVLIIGILASVALPQYNRAVKKARATEAILNLKTIAQARALYFLENGSNTADLSQLDITVQDGFYHYYCLEGGNCYAIPKDGSVPYFEGDPSNTLFCRGTAQECKPFSNEPWGSGYFVIHL